MLKGACRITIHTICTVDSINRAPGPSQSTSQMLTATLMLIIFNPLKKDRQPLYKGMAFPFIHTFHLYEHSRLLRIACCMYFGFICTMCSVVHDKIEMLASSDIHDCMYRKTCSIKVNKLFYCSYTYQGSFLP